MVLIISDGCLAAKSLTAFLESELEEIMDGMVKKIYGHVTSDTYYAIIERAKRSKSFMDEEGWVDVGALTATIAENYANGSFVITKDKPIDPKSKDKNADNKKVYGYVSPKVYYDVIGRSKETGFFCNDEGYVDIGDLMTALFEAYAEGRYDIGEVRPMASKEPKREHQPRFQPYSKGELKKGIDELEAPAEPAAIAEQVSDTAGIPEKRPSKKGNKAEPVADNV